jgi:hypothetical protein
MAMVFMPSGFFAGVPKWGDVSVFGQAKPQAPALAASLSFLPKPASPGVFLPAENGNG